MGQSVGADLLQTHLFSARVGASQAQHLLIIACDGRMDRALVDSRPYPSKEESFIDQAH